MEQHSDETLAIMYTQSFFVAISMLEFCAKEMARFHKIKGESKRRINLMYNFVVNWKKTQLDTDSIKKIEELSAEHFSHLLTANLSLCLVHPDQLEWVQDELTRICLAAHNRQTLESKKQTKP